MADGRVVTASQETNEHLAVALRGGGNNFGVVTSVTLSTFKQGKMGTGALYHFDGVSDQLMKAYVDFCAPETYDADSTAMIVFGFNGQLKKSTPLSILQHHHAVRNPPSLRPFTSLSRFWSTTKLRSLLNAAEEIGGLSPAGFRRFYWTTTFKNDLEMLQEAKAIYDTTLDTVRNVKGIVWCLALQSLVTSATKHHQKNAVGGKLRC